MPPETSLLQSGFFIDAIPANAVTGVYDYGLVLLSYFVACMASYTAFTLTSRLVAETEREFQYIWHYGGAFAMGAGIWSMHFIGMIAYKTDMLHTYHTGMTLFSLLVAIVIAYAVLHIVKGKSLSFGTIGSAALLLGFGICTMHYTGMAAMDMDGDIRYLPVPFMLSILIAVSASAAALWLLFTLTRLESRYTQVFILGSSMVMGLAICGMHYMGMAATVFIPWADCRFDPEQDFNALAFAVAGVSIVLLVLTHFLESIVRFLKFKDIGHRTFIQLSILLGVWLSLFIVAFMINGQKLRDQENDSAIMNSVGLQRMLIQLHTREVTGMIAAHAASDWVAILEFRKKADQTARLVRDNFKGFLEGGAIITTFDGSQTITIEALGDETVRQELQKALDEWRILKQTANKALQSDVTNIVGDSRFEALSFQANKTVAAQDSAAFLMQESIKDKNATILQIWLMTLIAGVGLFIATVYYTYHRIAKPLSKTTQELEHHRDNLQHMVQEQTIDLIRAKDEAEEANRMKSEFLANMSHEIRTPMNGVLGMTDLLLRTDLTVDQEELAKTVRKSADALQSVINDILDFSKIESGQLTLEPLSFNLRHTVEDVADIFAAPSEDKGLELIVRYVPETPDYIVADPGRIRQILTNLVNNAIKFTSEGHVLVTVEALENDGENARLRLSVTDTGIGISEEAQAKIFSRFTQADASTTRRFGGTGLGLAICKQLVELMGGQIGLGSQPGSGSTFWFELPVEIDASAETEAYDQDRREQLQTLDRKRILVVDDNPINCHVFQEYIDSYGAKLFVAINAQEAMDKLKEHHTSETPIDIIILDQQLPDEDGFELGKKLIQSTEYGDIPIVICTSMAVMGSAKQFEEAGFSGYLTKPLKRRLLESMLVAVLGRMGIAQMVTRHNVRRSSNRTEQIAKDLSILIVEDDTVNQKVATRMVTELGARVTIAGNGLEALEAEKRESFDLIFMDMQMPEMDGVTAAGKIREREKSNQLDHTPIIAFTANATRKDKEKCYMAGMNDFITKPISIEKFEACLGKWIEAEQLSERKDEAQKEIQEPESHAETQVEQDTDEVPGMVIDFSSLDAITGGDEDIKAELIQDFITGAEISMTTLSDDTSAEDIWRKAAHKLKGSAATLGFTDFSALCGRAEIEMTPENRPQFKMDLEKSYNTLRQQIG